MRPQLGRAPRKKGAVSVLFIPNRVSRVAIAFLLVAAGAFFGMQSHQAPIVEMYEPVHARGHEMPIFYVRTERKACALTFDISWGEKMPDKVLDILKDESVKATFFLSGPWASRHRNVVKRIVGDGHELASHGHDHVNLSEYSKEEIAENIRQADNILTNLSGATLKYFRPPNGDYDDIVVLTARELGYETVIWSVDSIDWKNPGVSYIVQRVSGLVFPGAIILFHASDSAPQTPEALPLVIENLRSAGYELVTLGQLMEMGTPARDDPRGRPRSELPGS